MTAKPTPPKQNQEKVLSSTLKKIVSKVKQPANFDEEKELRVYFENKHL